MAGSTSIGQFARVRRLDAATAADIEWTDAPYWPQQVLRTEVEAMLHAIRDGLLEVANPNQLLRIVAKGSALRTWDSVIDYVPEVSDVDVHVDVKDDEDAKAYEHDLSFAVALRRQIAERFAAAISEPPHYPRPQLIFTNGRDFLPSPAGIVRLLHGETYRAGTSASVAERPRTDAFGELRGHQEFVARIGASLLDKPGRYLETTLRYLTWRVSPSLPLLLLVHGADWAECWSSNRTGIVSSALDRGWHEAVEHYCAYYRACWGWVLSRGGDDATLVDAVVSASKLYREVEGLLPN